jgi:single-stranded DNA-binding protein
MGAKGRQVARRGRVHENSWEVNDGFVIRTLPEEVFQARFAKHEE